MEKRTVGSKLRGMLAEDYHIGTHTVALLLGASFQKVLRFHDVWGWERYGGDDRPVFEHFRCFCELLSNLTDAEFAELDILNSLPEMGER